MGYTLQSSIINRENDLRVGEIQSSSEGLALTLTKSVQQLQKYAE